MEFLKRAFNVLRHCTIGALWAWAFGRDEGGGWNNWVDQLVLIINGEM